MKKKYLGTVLAVSAFLFSGGNAIAQSDDCGVKTIPYVEHFDTDSWESETVLNCWRIVDDNNDNKTWKRSTNSGVDGSACAQYTYNSQKPASDWLISPQINIDRPASVSFMVKAQSSMYAEKYSVWISKTGFDIADFEEIKSETVVDNTAFTEVIVDLGDYEGQQIYVAIKAVSDKDRSSLYVDEFQVISCAPPGNFEITDISTTSATIGFTSSAQEFEWEYKTVTAESWIEGETATTNEISLENLLPGTKYQLRAKAICGEGDESAFSSVFEFTTHCAVQNIPYAMYFEENDWLSSKEINCWTIVGSKWSQNKWYGVDGTGAIEGGSGPEDDWLISPQINLDREVSFSFEIRANSSYGSGKYSVWVSENTAAIADFVEIQAETELTSTDYAKVSPDLSAYQGKQIFIAIKNTSASGYGNGFYLDNFMLVSCGEPTDVHLTELLETSAKIDFTSAAASFVVEYKTQDADTWTVLPAQSTRPLSITALESGVKYQVRVKALCSEDDESLYSDEITFTTPCSAFDFPFIAEFSGNTIPACWDADDYKGKDWKATSSWRGNYVYYSGSNQQYGLLHTPDIDISTAVKSRLELEINYAVNATSGQYFSIAYSTDRGISWDTLEQPFTSYSQITENVMLGDLVGDASVLRIRLIGKGSSNLYGDGISVYGLKIQNSPICFPPTNLKTADILYNETRLVWGEPATESMDGNIAAYEVSYMKEGDTTTAKMVEATAPDTTVLLTGLQQHTDYIASVQTVCQTEKSLPVKISWETPYSCVKVDSLRLVGVKSDFATIQWVSKNNLFELKYREDGAEDWNEVSGITATIYQVTGLKASANYTVYVRSVCSEDDQSIWDSIKFSTANKPLPLPYVEGFEGSALPSYWTYAWLGKSGSSTPWSVETAAHKEGEKSLRFYSYMLNNLSSVMASPLLDFSLEATYTLEFWMYRDPACKKENEGLKVFVGENATDTVGARFLTYIHNNIQKEPVVEQAEDNWYHYSVSLSGVSGQQYILLCGIAEYDKSFYIDDFKVNALYETNLGLTEIAPIVPRAGLNKETVRVSLVNTGVDDLRKPADIYFCVDDGQAVKETIDFEAENLTPDTRYEYIFAEKADFSQVGKHTLAVWVSVPGEPTFDDTLHLEVLHYAPVELPYATLFNGEEESDAYIHIVNLNNDSLTWVRSEEGEGMFLAPNPNVASNDVLFTPGFNMPAGIYNMEAVYGAADENLSESLSVRLVKDFESDGDSVMAQTAIGKERDSATAEFTLRERGIYMLRFKGESLAAQGGLSLYAVRFTRLQTWAEASESICDGDVYLFRGKELSEAGVYTDTVFRAEHAVDSLITLTLSVNPVYSFNLKENICQGETYEFAGETYTEAGEYTVEYKTQSGCDSVYHISLSVNPVYSFNLEASICQGESYEFGGETYTETGEYTVEYKTQSGCDSVYTLNLTVNSLPDAPVISGTNEGKQWILTARTEEERVQWYNRQGAIEGADALTYTATEEGFYHATALNGCGESAASNEIEVIFTGVEDGMDAAAPVMYPNPARDVVRITSPNEVENIAIYAQSGRLIKERKDVRGTEISLSVADLQAGVYMVRIRTHAGSYTYKMIVNR